MGARRDSVIAGLDIGSSKVSCFIARPEESADHPRGPKLRVIGIGHQVSRGVRAGAVIDMDGAEGAIRAAVDTAERMAGVRLRDVFVSLGAGQPESHKVAVEVTLAGHEIGDGDVRRVLAQGRGQGAPADRQVVHSIPAGYSIDGARGIRDPRGLFGERLGVNMHVVTAGLSPVRSIASCVSRCHLGVAGLVVSPFAAGLSCLVDDERDLGATVLDMGGGLTGIAMFYDGALVHLDTVPIGGNHITSDIARGLGTTLAHAERLKTLYGSVLASHSDENETISVPQVGEGDAQGVNHVPRSLLVGIIRPRVEELFEWVRERIERSGIEHLAGRRLVLTGGGSQLQGVRETAARMLDKPVRLARPQQVSGLAEATGGPAFSACAGLLAYGMSRRAEAGERGETGGWRLARWLRASL